jgi:rfaE bifunctional protein kinase chain/domain
LIELSERRLREIFKNISGKRVAIIGDLMLDRYIWGIVNRISPEAPVAVVDVQTEQDRLGGAANVAKNIQSLGGEPFLIGVIGDDSNGETLTKLSRECHFLEEGIVKDSTRPTTVKTRIIAHNQHVVRIDHESKLDISKSIQEKILKILRQNIADFDAIIVEDYNKGVVTKPLIHDVIALAEKHDKVINIDPKFHNFFEYTNVSVFKPNRKEIEEALGVKIFGDEDAVRAAKEVIHRLKAKNVLLTRGENGMSLIDESGGVYHAPTKARNIADVSGAGDTVIATLTLAMAGGASVREAATLANYAGGVVCEFVGIVPIEKELLRSAVLNNGALPKPRKDKR